MLLRIMEKTKQNKTWQQYKGKKQSSTKQHSVRVCVPTAPVGRRLTSGSRSWTRRSWGSHLHSLGSSGFHTFRHKRKQNPVSGVATTFLNFSHKITVTLLQESLRKSIIYEIASKNGTARLISYSMGMSAYLNQKSDLTMTQSHHLRLSLNI